VIFKDIESNIEDIDGDIVEMAIFCRCSGCEDLHFWMISKLLVLFIAFLFFIVVFRNFLPHLANVVIFAGLGRLKTKSFIPGIFFFIIFEPMVCKIPAGGDNRLAEFIPRWQEQVSGRTLRAPASEMIAELSLPCGFSVGLERAKNVLEDEVDSQLSCREDDRIGNVCRISVYQLKNRFAVRHFMHPFQRENHQIVCAPS
jgi:hypothetical protein